MRKATHPCGSSRLITKKILNLCAKSTNRSNLASVPNPQSRKTLRRLLNNQDAVGRTLGPLPEYARFIAKRIVTQKAFASICSPPSRNARAKAPAERTLGAGVNYDSFARERTFKVRNRSHPRNMIDTLCPHHPHSWIIVAAKSFSAVKRCHENVSCHHRRTVWSAHGTARLAGHRRMDAFEHRPWFSVRDGCPDCPARCFLLLGLLAAADLVRRSNQARKHAAGKRSK